VAAECLPGLDRRSAWFLDSRRLTDKPGDWEAATKVAIPMRSRIAIQRLLLLLVLLLVLSSCDESSEEARRPTNASIDRIIRHLDGLRVDLPPEGSEPPQSAFSGQNLQTVKDYLTFALENNDRVWTKLFIDARLQEPFVNHEIVEEGEAFAMRCPIAGRMINVLHDTPNAYYCSSDGNGEGMIYLPLSTMGKMWTGDIFGSQSPRQGDFAAAILTSHEFGHDIVAEYREQYSQRDGVRYGSPTGKYFELIADCMAGVWAASVYYQGYLENGDFEEAVGALEAIGDYNLSSATHHGTPAERVQALRTGYHGIPGVTSPGSPVACVKKYWVTS
jgi:hypothetical protein